ncbi:hypothetical protein BV25DRAFT_1862304, partial [Artomyces pyxidatus]
MAKSSGRVKSAFDVSSVRFCDACRVDVRIGTGGEANWSAHVLSKAHIRNAKPAQKTTLNAFFSKTSAPSPSLSSIPTAKPLHIPSLLPNVTVLAASASSHVSPPPPRAVVTRPAVSPLIQQLRAAVRALPDSVAVACPDDSIYWFAQGPSLDPSDDDPWEAIDRSLNALLGWGADTSEIAAKIRRGPYGLEGLCNYFDICISELGIAEALLEAKVARLLEAAKSLTSATEARRSPSVINVDKIPELDLDDDIQIVEQPPPPPISQGGTVVSPLAVSGSVAGDRAGSQRSRYEDRPCPGYHIEVPVGQSPFMSYPYGLHATRRLPWSITMTNESLVLHSESCTRLALSSPRHVEGSPPLPCLFCKDLHNHSIIMGIRHRALDGAHESLSWAYLTGSQMVNSLQQKRRQIDEMKLNALTISRKLVVRDCRIESWKRLALAISESNIPRIRSLLQVQIKNGAGVLGLLSQIDNAARRVYRPMSYDQADFQRAYLLWKMGGRPAAILAYNTLGTPSIDSARRHVATLPIQSSVGTPTLDEINHNLSIYIVPDQTRSAAGSRITGMTMVIDEIKIQERLRWDARRNMILGVCREHGHNYALEFRTMVQANALLDGLNTQDVHLATEASVIGTCVLTDNPQEYTVKPLVLSPTCKREDSVRHGRMLQITSDALRAKHGLLGRRLYCIASDGESRRRKSLVALTLVRKLPPSSPLYPLLSPLSLLNTHCGDDDITPDWDWKHNMKRFRNTLLRQKGVRIDGTNITTSILRVHLLQSGMAETTVNAVLSPNDKQDVVLMLQLLNTLAHLPDLPADSPPTSHSSRRILRLLGQIYDLFLKAYLDISLSLHEQMSNLSAAAHLVLALYSRDKGNFIPAQLYFDFISMVKNVYFCVAKAQLDNPDSSFWIILLGTDGLEDLFGKVRTMIGNDTNADLLQLGDRIDGAVQCVKILQEHPDWAPRARRLHVKALDEQGSEISSKLDHLSPRSWKGDVKVGNVIPFSSWRAGRIRADNILRDFALTSPFAQMEADLGYDILCPFGRDAMVLADGTLETGEEEETEEEASDASGSVGQPSSESGIHDGGQIPQRDEDSLPDLDDLANIEEAHAETGAKKYEAWVLLDVDDNDGHSDNNIRGKRQHKSAVMAEYSKPLASADSKDRLKRVRGFTQYNDHRSPSTNLEPLLGDDDTELANIFTAEDPAITLVQCADSIFLAVIQILDIRYDNTSVHSLPTRLLHEPNVRIRAQTMSLVEFDSSHQPNRPDFEWTGSFETLPALRELEGRWVNLINPVLQQRSRGVSAGTVTYVFQTSELRQMAYTLFAQVRSERHRLPSLASPTDTFPYRNMAGEACFVCETSTDSTTQSRDPDGDSCPCCPAISISGLTGPQRLQHMGAHILHDPKLKDADSPCGFCLSSSCVIYLSHRRSANINEQIDMSKSQCPHLIKVSLKVASEHSMTSPCTNAPIRCPLCPQPHSPAVWKYNLEQHIRIHHPMANVELYKDTYEVTGPELVLMKGVYLTKPRKSKKKRLASRVLPISDSHSTRMVMWTSVDVDEDADEAVLGTTLADDSEPPLDGHLPLDGEPPIEDEPPLIDELRTL